MRPAGQRRSIPYAAGFLRDSRRLLVNIVLGVAVGWGGIGIRINPNAIRRGLFDEKVHVRWGGHLMNEEHGVGQVRWSGRVWRDQGFGQLVVVDPVGVVLMGSTAMDLTRSIPAG